MVLKRAFFSTALGLTLVSLAGPVSARAESTLPLTVGDIPSNILGLAALQQRVKTEPLAVSRGTVLLRRTQEALPPPSQAELESKMRMLAANAAQDAAGKVQAETLAAIKTRQGDMDQRLGRLSADTTALLEQTRQSLMATETRLTSLAQSNAAQTAAVLQANTNAQQAQLAAQKDALLAMNTQNQTLQQQLSGLQRQTAQALQTLASQQASNAADTKEYARLQALTAQLTAQKDALVAAQQAAQAAEHRVKEATQAQVASVKGETAQALQTLASQQASNTADTKEYARLQALTAQLTAQKDALVAAQQAAQAAESRVKEATQAQVASVKGETAQALQTLAMRQDWDAKTAREFAELKAKDAQNTAMLAAISGTQGVQAQVAQLQGVALAQIQQVKDRQTLAEAVSAERLKSVKELTEARLAAVEQLSATNRKLAEAETRQMVAELKGYADNQMAQIAANTSATVARVASASRQDVEALRNQTTRHLGILWQAAQQQAAAVAEQKAGIVAQSLARLEKETDTKRLTPEQVKTLASQAIADAQPELRALALQTMKEGQDYIRTIARDTLQNPDPAVAEALANATRDVITKDNKIVFALRKAVEDGMSKPGVPQVTVNVAAASPTSIRLGNGWGMGPAAVVGVGHPLTSGSGGKEDALTKDLAALQWQTVQTLARLEAAARTDKTLEGMVAELKTQKDMLAAIQSRMDARKTGMEAPKAEVAAVKPISATATPVVVADGVPLKGITPLTASETEVIDAARLRIAALQDPTVVPVVKATSNTLAEAFLAALSPAAGIPPVPASPVSETQAALAVAGAPTWSPPAPTGKTSILSRRPREGLMDIRKYRVVVHDDNKPLETLMNEVVGRAEPFTGPWQVKWKISEANKDILAEKFSLDAETSFDDFVGYVAQYMVNERGVKLTFSLFDNERIIVISD